MSADPSLRTATGLGYLAVVPFVAGAVLTWLVAVDAKPLAAQALSAYAAVVISFIGAIHWGVAFTRPSPATRTLVWGVIPSLVACAAVLMAPKPALLVHAAMLVGCFVVDRVLYRHEGIARWLPLRLKLTAFATVCCLAGAAAL